AYQTVGDNAGLDTVFISGWASHLGGMWEGRWLARPLRRLAQFSRLIVFDKRGTGLSDPVPLKDMPSLEERVDDVRAVMDAAGSERAALLAVNEGSAVALMFAALYPDRTAAVVLVNASAHARQDADTPWGIPSDKVEQRTADMRRRWGTEPPREIFGDLAPSLVDDPDFIRFYRRYQQLSASPGVAAALGNAAFSDDARPLLPLVQAPTLVLHRSGNRILTTEHGEYLAKNIAKARYLELAGEDHLWFAGDTDALVDEVQEFLTGMRRPTPAERVLATVLFTDIANSTHQLATLGDRRWKEVLDEHHSLIRRQLERFRGTEVKTTGDGVLARFDGPARAIRCACAIRDGVRSLGIEVRAGLHAGEVAVQGDDLNGIAVHIGARVTDMAAEGEVLVSSTVRELVAGSDIDFAERGEHELKGVPGLWRLFRVEAV
ncbi:MAG TPA: adenylate/guanylate cyclase domain-containing protein, partial [Acidimicrobiales bacterium]|nr:adenylate/guanylate cyclase domain-containing protein [Acidimicrobiales bacterium]